MFKRSLFATDSEKSENANKKNPFEEIIKNIEACDVVFVADAFSEDYLGGAELTTEAIIKKSKYKFSANFFRGK